MPRNARRDMQLPLYVNIFTIFLILAVLIVGGVTWYIYRSTSDAALQTANNLIGEVSDKISQRTRRLFETVEALADATVALPSLLHRGDVRASLMRPYLLQLLDSHPTIYSALIGYGDGTALQVIAVRGPDMGAVLQSLDGPVGTRFVQRTIHLDAAGRRRQSWLFLGATGVALARRDDAAADYDPRERPWFRAAIDTPGRHVTEPYTFASYDALGITVSRRFEGAKPGVFGIDLTLDSLSDFLSEQIVSPNAVLAIVDGDGHLLAHADPDLVLRRHGGGQGHRRVHVDRLDDAVLARMRDSLPPGALARDQHLRFPVEGVDYLGTAAPLDSSMEGWHTLLVAAPEADFVGPIQRIQRDGLIAAAAALLLALPLIWLVSRRIAAPLTALAEEAYRIRHLDLSPRPDVRSFILEIDRLAQSVARMKGALAIFTRYVPRGLLEQIMAGAGSAELGGERRDVTVLFSDITGFTAQSETIAPEELMRRTSLYFEEVTEAIGSHGGVIDKFIGDAVMALWNAPRPDPDHAALACRGALAAQARLAGFNAALVASGKPPMPTRIGLHTGPCVVGNVGSSDRMNYTAIGANVNLAARLEGLAGHYGTGILVSAAIRDAVGDRFLFRSVARVGPKGVAAPVAVHELLAEAGSPAAAGCEPMLADWERAVALRDGGDPAEAARLFAARLAAEPDDAVAARALAQCRALADGATPEWDGVDRFDQK
ncbi:MAG: adenylate/guanylate cyclase domain-containing protein [Sneathiellaceae bacterium]